MVPVPEELVQEAMKMVIRLSQSDKMHEWDEESISQVFHDAPEMAKAVLSAVARGTLGEDGHVKEDELARSMEHSLREVRELARELNKNATDNAYGPVIGIQTTTETLPNGRTREERQLLMDPKIAEWVRAAEREELKQSPHPLLGEG